MAPILCLCGAKFVNLHALHQHAVDKGHFYQCNSVQCGALFSSASAVADHQGNVEHEGSIAPLAVLEDYDPTHTSDEQLSLKCSVCDNNKKPFKDITSLMHHTFDKHPTCPICQQVFDSTSQRLGHQEVSRALYSIRSYCISHIFANLCGCLP